MNTRNTKTKLIINTILLTAVLAAGCSNEDLNVQLSKATSEVDKHAGVIIYSGFRFPLVRVHIANSKGGLVQIDR